jgi:tetratricopeptide (TPR) repeat protein
MSEHLTEEQTRRFIEGDLSPEENRNALTHVLLCPLCARQLDPLALSGATPAEPEKLEPAVDRAYDAAIDRAYQSALRAARDSEARRASSPASRFDHSDLEQVSELLDRSFAVRYSDPREMVRLAERAATTAKRLDPLRYGPALRADWRARSLAELANAYRVAERFDDSADAYAEAETQCHQGTLDVLLFARLLDVRASLLADRRELGAACEILRQLHLLYLEVGEVHPAGRALVSRGIYTHFAGDPRAAVGFLSDGLLLLDRERDPALAAGAEQGLLHALVDCGQVAEAAAILRRSGLRQAFAGQPLNLAKLLCLEGKIHKGLGHLVPAEKALREARTLLARHSQLFVWGMAGLELASVWLRQGKLDAVREVAEETYATFCDLEIHREAKAALEVLLEACRRERATVHLVERLGGFFERLEQDPQLAFSREALA